MPQYQSNVIENSHCMKQAYLLFITFSFVVHSYGSIKVCSDTVNIEPDSSKGFIMRPNLLVNLYSTRPSGDRQSKGKDFSYNYKEASIMGYYPIFERNYSKKGNTNYKPNLSVLATGSVAVSQVNLSIINNLQPFTRISAGLRTIYFDGNKSIWMASFSPFISESGSTFKNLVPRFFASALYSRSVSEYFSYRVGFTFTYLLNGGIFLPLIGFRVGDYNKVYFNFQLPKDISLNFRISSKCMIGVFTRLNGGIYRFSTDQPLIDYVKGDNIKKIKNVSSDAIVLYRTELLTGFMFNYAPNSNLYFSLNAGFATQRSISIAKTNEFIPIRNHILNNEPVRGSLFINLSISYFFGKPTYSGGYNYLIEEKAINNNNDVGDLNIGNNQINNDMNIVKPKDVSKRDIKKLNASYLDLRDLLLDE
jgi:hypothetical protein